MDSSRPTSLVPVFRALATCGEFLWVRKWVQKKEARVKNTTIRNRHKVNKMVSTNRLVASMVVYITGLRIVVLEITFEQW